MHKIIGIIAVVFSLLSVLLIGNLLYGILTDGFGNGTGMAIIAFQLYGIITAVIGIVLALISRFLAKRAAVLPHGSTRLAIAASVIALVSLGLAMIFMG